MVDLAVPRDIEPAVAELEDVYLFSIDDLQQLIDENLQQREVAAGGAALLIEEEVARFLAETRANDAGPAIRRCASRPKPSARKPSSRRGAC
jgi:glutamyl-tRNA reductase